MITAQEPAWPAVFGEVPSREHHRGIMDAGTQLLEDIPRVHKKYLGGYVTKCEFAINLKRVTPV